MKIQEDILHIKMFTAIDVINNNLGDVINNSGLLQDITNSWSLNSLEQGKLGVCAQKCGIEFDPFGEQFT